VNVIFKTVIILLSFFLPCLAYSQDKEIRFEKITMEDGLSQSTGNCILKDKKGYMWFGTALGLNRYDGYQFKVFKNTPDDTTSLSSNYISCLYEDRDSVLWVGTFTGGINKFNRDKEIFEVLKIPPGNNNVLSINSIYEDPAGNLYFGANGGGVIFLNKETNDIKVIKADPLRESRKEANIVRDFFVDNNSLFAVSVIGVHKIDTSEKFEHSVLHAEKDLPILKSVFRDKSNVLWIATEMGLGKLNEDDNGFTIDFPFKEFEDVPINDVVEDRYENLLVCTLGKGLAIIDKKRTAIDFYTKNSSDPYAINNDDLISAYRDNTDIIWIGGYGGGINKYDGAINKFQNLRNYYSDNLTSLIEDKNGAVWFVNGSKGVTRWELSGNKMQNFNNKDYWQLRLCEDNYGNIWSVHPQLGLSRFSAEEQQFIIQVKSPHGYALINGQDGKLYAVFSGKGLNAVDPLTNQTEDIVTSDKLKIIYCLFPGQDYNIWMGGKAGLIGELNLATRRVREHRLVYEAGPLEARIVAMIEDSKGNLWVAPQGRGLFLIDKHTKKVLKVYNEGNGMPNNEVVALLEDTRGNIWISTNNGLAVLNPVTEKIKTFYTQDGLVHNEFNSFVAFRNKEGKLYFGGMEGFNHFYPEDLAENKVVPPVVLTDFQIFNKSVPVENSKGSATYYLQSEISRTKRIDLLHDQNVFSFEFAALNYSLPEKNQYAYKMEGFDKDWIYSGTKRSATYTNLNPGKYIFRVKAANNDGVWNTAGTAIGLVIHPPVYKTWWAYLLYFLLGFFLLYLIWRYFTNREKLKQALRLKGLESQKLQELDEIKTRFYTNVSHEFRTPLTLILGPLETAITMSAASGEPAIKTNLDMVNRNAQRLLELINQLMDFSKLESGNMHLHLEEADLIPFLRTCTLSFSSLAVSKGINLQFTTTAEQLITLFDKDKFEKIINNLLSNALKFTREGGSVAVAVDFNDQGVVLQVTDDGIGIPDDKVEDIFNRFYQVNNAAKIYEGTGIGLALLKELVAFHKGKVTVESKEGKGTVFTLQFPVEIRKIRKAASTQLLSVSREDAVSAEVNTNQLVSAYDPLAGKEAPHHSPDGREVEKDKQIILIVEDNHEIRSYIKGAFGTEYLLLESENGKMGLLAAEKNIPDLVITDIMMPVMDGQELCRQLKINEKTSHIPVILLTAKASQESKQEGYETGADDYITKPFHLKELQVRVKNLLEQREKLRKRFTREVVLKPRDIAITSADENFLNRCIAEIEKHMADPDFNVDAFGKAVGMSRSQLHRKLKALVDQTTTEFIKNIRLKRAAELIKKGYGNTAEVAYEVGFNNVSYFIKCFKEVYGKTPTEIGNNSVNI
jgi:signal transduction histidine kinase/DNA-binding response OmpR family regulator/ligand-binding sensor domain-containing protein